jgi:hypothetical protein
MTTPDGAGRPRKRTKRATPPKAPPPPPLWFQHHAWRALEPATFTWERPSSRDVEAHRLEVVESGALLGGLRELDLRGAAGIDDVAAAALAALGGLERLVLDGTNVGDDVLPALARLPRLASLDLRRTRVSEAGARGLPDHIPRAGIRLAEGDLLSERLAYSGSRCGKCGKPTKTLINGTCMGCFTP